MKWKKSRERSPQRSLMPSPASIAGSAPTAVFALPPRSVSTQFLSIGNQAAGTSAKKLRGRFSASPRFYFG